MTTTPPTMNITEAADTLKIHPHSLEKIIRAGDIPAGRVGRAYVLMTRDVLAYAGIITLLKINDLKIIICSVKPRRSGRGGKERKR